MNNKFNRSPLNKFTNKTVIVVKKSDEIYEVAKSLINTEIKKNRNKNLLYFYKLTKKNFLPNFLEKRKKFLTSHFLEFLIDLSDIKRVIV